MKQFLLHIIIIICTTSSLAFAKSINIVGSSTVYPFSATVSELFSQATNKGAPKVEATGSGGGMKLFCASNNKNAADITNSSRRMKASEQKLCAENGIKNILEVKIGYDGIVIAQNIHATTIDLTRRQLFLALARSLPNAAGDLVKNPHHTWRDIDPSLPDTAILVYGPPPTSGTRDALAELALEKGCASFPQLKSMEKSDKKKYQAICHSIREDGAFIESGENDNLIIQKSVSNPDALGIFGFSFLEHNRDKVRGISIDGSAPTFDAIADGSYPLSRPLYFYANLDHYSNNPVLKEFVNFFVSSEVMGQDGVLIDLGLIPLPEEEYDAVTDATQANLPMPPL